VRRVVILDAGPVGLASKAAGKPEVSLCQDWIASLIRVGTIVAVPEIARYEVRRELVRVGAHAGLRRLDEFQNDLFFLPITSQIMDRASELWAEVRRQGLPTAGDAALDGDAILAAHALVMIQAGHRVVVATTNVAHLSRFRGVMALDWRSIV
jgi:predicted nucleic acid-binding protein